MDAKHIAQANALHRDVTLALEALRVSDALYALGGVQLIHTHWALREAYEEVQQMHQQMMSYMIRGVKDELRDEPYTKMQRLLFELNNLVLVHNLAESQEEYYSVRRYTQQRHLSIEQEMARLSTSLKRLASQHDVASKPELRTQYSEALAEGYAHCDNLFKLIWTSLPLTSAEQEVLHTSLHDTTLPEAFRGAWISALLLGIYQHLDIVKIRLLAHLLSAPYPLLQARALVALCIALTRHEAQLARYYPKEYAAIHTLLTRADYAQWVTEVQELLSISLLTEERVRHANEAFVNTLTQLRQELNNNTTPTPSESLAIEAELEAVMTRLRSLYERHADIHYGAFAMMKHRLPFYKTMMHWLMPFTDKHPALHNTSTANSSNAWLMQLPLCASDRYTLALLLASIPREGHAQLIEQMNMSGVSETQLAETLNTPEEPTVSSEIRYYLQDLYRFFALYSSQQAYGHWFADTQVLTKSAILTASLQKTKRLSALADDAFTLGLYASARQLYQASEQAEGLGSEHFYHLGLCLQREQDLKAAMGYYEKADLLSPHTPKILRALARGYKRLKNLPQALHYYKACEQLEPESPPLLMQIGNLLLELGHHEEALTYFYKADYLSEGATDSVRAIAWSNFMMGNAVQAEKYYTKLLAAQPTNEDYINAGHFYWSVGNIAQATQCYRSVTNDAAQMVRQDQPSLLAKGISASDIALMCDWLTEQAKQ